MISLMPGRYDMLKSVLAGYKQTGLQLIGYDGKTIFPSDVGDDIGMHYFVPKLARFFNLSLDQAIDIFFGDIVLTSLVLGIIGFFLLSKSWLFRIIATTALCFLFFVASYGVLGIYLVQAAIVVGVVPLALYFLQKNRFSFSFGLFLCFSGAAISISHYIRAFSSVAVFLFLVMGIFFFLTVACKQKTILFAILCIGIVLPVLHFRAVLQQRREFFGDEYKNYPEMHPLWHSVYAGFGFLNNDFGIKHDDQVIFDKVKETYPGVVYQSKAYEAAAREGVFKLIREQFSFVRNTLFAKLGVIIYFLLLFINIGLPAAYLYRKPWILDLMFWCAIGFNSIFGFIALPGRYYLLGMIAFAVVYGLVSIEYAIAQGAKQDIFRGKRKIF